MLTSKEKGSSPSVWDEKAIGKGLDMPTEQMMSYPCLRGRKTKLVPSVVLLCLSGGKIVSLETSKENMPRRKLVRRLPMDSVLVEVHLGPPVPSSIIFCSFVRIY